MRNFSKFLMLVLFVVLMMCGIVGCSKDNKTTIGILQIASVSALDDAREGFIEALEKAGFKDGENINIIYRNPEGDGIILGTYATQLVRECDMVLGIATLSAQQLLQAAQKAKKDIPILYTAVTDPISAGLTGDNITGTNDMNPVADQVDLIHQLLPECKKMGIIYNINEVNSKVQSDIAVAQASKAGITTLVKTVTDATQISAIAASLINDGVTAMYVPTDTLIANNLTMITNKCTEDKVLVVVGESGMLAQGGSITYSINYKELGKLTGDIAVRILNGEKPSDIPSTTVDSNGIELLVNEENLSEIGITLPESIRSKIKK